MASQSRGGRGQQTHAANSSVFARIPTLIARTPRPLWYVFGFLTSSYFLTTFLIGKVSELHSRITQESNSKDGLKRGFKQNQEDVGFTIMALLPMLGKGMDDVFDVDGVTRELKEGVARSAQVTHAAAEPAQEVPAVEQVGQIDPAVPEKAANADEKPQTDAIAPEPALTNGDANAGAEGSAKAVNGVSETETETAANTNGNAGEHEQEVSAAGEEAVMQTKSHVPPAEDVSAKGDTTANAPADDNLGKETQKDRTDDSPESSEEDKQRQQREAEAKLERERQEAEERRVEAERIEAERIEAERIEAERRRVEAEALERTRQEEEAARAAAAAAERKRKAELWNQLKIASVSRYLTTVYAANLLSVLTNVQLSLLGRYSYLRSLSSDKDGDDAAKSSTATTTAGSTDPLEDAWARSASASASTSTSASGSGPAKLTQQTEEEYLTFSWYFLHVGWKQLASRVQAQVEEALRDVPLKTQLSHADTVRLLRRVRRRIEYDYVDAGDALDAASSPPPPRPAFMGAESLMADMPHSPNSEMSSSMLSTTSTNGGKRRRRGHGQRKRINLLQYLLPTTPEGDLQVLESAGVVGERAALHAGSALSSLLDETRDVLESRDAGNVLRACLTQSFDESFESMAGAFGLSSEELDHLTNARAESTNPTAGASSLRIRELQTAQEEEEVRLNPHTHGNRLKLAAILPVVAREANLITQGMPSSVVEAIASVKDLKAFSAIIYSSWTSGIDG